jgi:hypothetical protein
MGGELRICKARPDAGFGRGTRPGGGQRLVKRLLLGPLNGAGLGFKV